MALKIYLTAGTGTLNFQDGAEPLRNYPSQHIKYVNNGDTYYSFYDLSVKKGSGFMYRKIWSDLVDSVGAALGVDEKATREALDAIIGVQKTV